MGNYKFKFSDIVPNAWFFKLKDMSRASKTQDRSHHSRTSSPSNHNPSHKEAFIPSRASYYFSGKAKPELRASDTISPPEVPRKSKGRRRRKPISPKANLVSSSVSSGCRSRIDAGDDAEDLICTSVRTKSLVPELRPIVTKSVKKETEQGMTRRSLAGIHRLRMRASSPRTAARKVQVSWKTVSKREKVLSESFAVVKSSSDPQKDFRDSMVEMIVENNIRKTTDLEELLACYLSLNSKEYHDVIVKVFEQIWLNLIEIRSYVKSTV